MAEHDPDGGNVEGGFGESRYLGPFGDQPTDASYEHTHLVLECAHSLVVRHVDSLQSSDPQVWLWGLSGDVSGSPAGRVTA